MASEKDKKESDDRWGRGSIFIPAGLFLGFGIGFLIDNVAGGMFLGFGIGFFAFAISLFFK